MKLEPNEQRQRKLIKILINSNSVDGRTFLINKKFYDLFPFDWEETNFIINTLKGKKLVSLYEPPKRLHIEEELFAEYHDMVRTHKNHLGTVIRWCVGITVTILIALWQVKRLL